MKSWCFLVLMEEEQLELLLVTSTLLSRDGKEGRGWWLRCKNSDVGLVTRITVNRKLIEEAHS